MPAVPVDLETCDDGTHPASQLVEVHVLARARVDLFHSTDVLREFSMDAADRWIACTRETNVTPPELVVIDPRTGAERKLAYLNPEFRHIRLGSVERVSGVNRFGEEWFGHLVKPSDYAEGKRYPLIATLYRSGDYFLVGATGNENPIQVYAVRGFQLQHRP